MAVEIAAEIASLVIEIGKLTWVPIKRPASYLFCYSRNIETFQVEVSNLERKIHEVQQDVDEAQQRGDTICVEVERWLENAENMKSKAPRLVDRSMNTKCWKGSCWAPVLWYGLGKEAAEKIIGVVQLKSDGNFERVSRPPPSPRIELSNRDFKDLPSTKKTINHVLDALQDDGINIIGVHGMAGVGKTTLMKEVAKQAKEQKLFDKIVMVTVSQNIVIKKIQDDIQAFLGKQLEENELMRTCMLSTRLKVGKSLVILDDLWDILDLSAVGIPCGGEHERCKIIITSRNLDVCRRMRSQKYIAIELLPEEESRTLFKAYVGGVVDSNKLFEVARNIVKECKGLPLAIRVLGLALRDKNDITVWNAILRKLRNSTPTAIPGMQKEVFEIIKYSFNHLGSEEAKFCFLFCCLFPEDANISLNDLTWYMVGEELIELTETLDEAKEEVSLYVDRLKTSGLLLESCFKGRVMMHDIVRDVAIEIAQEIYGFYSRPKAGLMEWPRNIRREDCQRLSLQNNEINVLPSEPLRFPNLHILLLNDNDYLEMVPNSFFSDMKALKVLDISRTAISSLPASLSGLTNLKVLDVGGCEKLRCLSGIGALKSLEILYLNDRVGINVLPIEVAELSNLRLLDLSDTGCMIPSKVISRLSKLEQLHMIHGFNEWQAQGSEDTSRAAFAELACLSRLRALTIDVKDEVCVSQPLRDGAFQKLERFQIRCFEEDCFSQDHINNQGDNFRVRIVDLVVPDWVKQLAGRADLLQLAHCPGVECLGDAEWDSLANTFSNIEASELYEMNNLRKLYNRAPPNAFLGCLKELVVKKCHKLTNIFSSDLMSAAHQLQVLKVRWCDQLSHVFHNDGALEGKSHNPILLPQLKDLVLYSLPRLTSIWQGGVPPQSLGSLQRLSISRGPSLKHVLYPTLAPALQQLEELEIRHCEQLEKLLSGELPSQSKSFLGLKELRVYECDKLISLFSWRQVQSLELLEELRISRCHGMVAIIMSEEENSEIQASKDSTSMLPWLKNFYLEDLEIASFDREAIALFDWPSLETIHIENCPNLKKLPLSSSSAPKLRSIRGSEAWFQALEWEDESIKSRLQTVFDSMDAPTSKLSGFIGL